VPRIGEGEDRPATVRFHDVAEVYRLCIAEPNDGLGVEPLANGHSGR
jgi:hypothetical protein